MGAEVVWRSSWLILCSRSVLWGALQENQIGMFSTISCIQSVRCFEEVMPFHIILPYLYEVEIIWFAEPRQKHGRFYTGERWGCSKEMFNSVFHLWCISIWTIGVTSQSGRHKSMKQMSQILENELEHLSSSRRIPEWTNAAFDGTFSCNPLFHF